MGEWGMEKLLIISHRGISSLQGLYICFRHSYTNASLPYVGFFGPVPTVGSHHAVPDLCIHIIKGRTLLFPWRPRICGGRDSVMLDRTTVIKMHGARGLFFCGMVVWLPLWLCSAAASAWCWHTMAAGLKEMVLIPIMSHSFLQPHFQIWG